MKTCGKDKKISNQKAKQTDLNPNCEKLLVKEDLQAIDHIY